MTLPDSADALYRRLVSAIDLRLRDVLAEVQPGDLRDALLHATSSGKRVRPVLMLLSCAAAGGSEEDALEAAIAFELLHTASLVHDDIMDGAVLRRGKQTLHTLSGVPMAILAGDTLTALAFQRVLAIAAPCRDAVVNAFADGFRHLCEGQGHDLSLSRMASVDGCAHHQMVEKKTARLLEAAAAVGAMHGTTKKWRIDALARYGLLLGLAYQAKDDILDVLGAEETAGKTLRSDARNGKATYLTVMPVASGALREATQIVEDYTRQACEALGPLPWTPARTLLQLLAHSLLEREH